jgi:hypothetical protein
MNELESSPTEADEPATEKKGFWTIDRIVIYSVLSVAVVVALNDYRVRSRWESDFTELQAAVTVANTPAVMDAANADATLVKTIRNGGGVSGWIADRGYAVDVSRSSEFEQVYSASSGVRTFFVNVDIRRSGVDGEREEIILVSRKDQYAWNVEGDEKENIVSQEPEGEASQGEQATNSGGGQREGAQRGGGEGGGEGGGGGRFDPEQIFAERDKDMDGLLSGDEISERMRPRVAAMDEDEDGAISKDEFLKAIAAIAAARRQSSGGGGGGGEDAIMQLPDDPYEQGELGFPDANALPADVEKLKKKLEAGQ